MKAFHGSPFLFDHFDLSTAGEGTGIKFGFGVYLTEVEKSAVHYSQPRGMDPMPQHYLYTTEIPDLTESNHLVSAMHVSPVIVKETCAKLGQEIPDKVTTAGKLFRKWVGMTLTGAKDTGFAEEKAAAEFFDSIGVFYNVWPTAQTKPEGPKNIAVFNADRVKILRTEQIEIENVRNKWVLVSRKDI